MKLIFAPDSFKGSLSAVRITEILEKTAARHFKGAELISVPVADGGEGTAEALVRAGRGTFKTAEVTGPDFRKVIAKYGVLDGGKTAVIEMAEASGLPLVNKEKANPLKATSLGTGELIKAALLGGAQKLLIGIGGSATNDGGVGLLTALGARFFDRAGRGAEPTGEGLQTIERVDLSGLAPQLKQAELTVLLDVSNPLLGENGATRVYGPQKGATPEQVEILERGMSHYAEKVARAVGHDIASASGAGAAGGVGAALGGVLGARLCSGIDAVLSAVHFDEMLEGASLVVTGEGRIDSQSVRYGKVPSGVARRCAAFPCW